MPPVGGIPLDCLDPTLDIPNKSSRRASIFDHSLGIPDSGARDRLSNPFGGPAYDLSRHSWVRSLAYKGRKRPWRFAFLPVGRAFLGGSRCDLVPARNSERPICEEEKGPLGGAFVGGLPLLSDLSVGGPWPINIPWHRRRSSFRLPPSCLCSLAV